MPQDFKGKEPIGWFTANGVHIPMYDGETPDDALNRVKENMNEKLPSRSFKTFRAIEGVEQETHDFFYDSDNANGYTWREGLDDDECRGLMRYTNSDDVWDINSALYENRLDRLTPNQRDVMENVDSALSKFQLYKGVSVTRQSDLRMLGIKTGFDKIKKQDIINQLQKTYGYIEYPAYLSAGVDDEGVGVAAIGVMVHIQVPPSMGAGAYLADSKTTGHTDENEFLFARNSVLKYDLNSLKSKSGIWEINARWVGVAEEE